MKARRALVISPRLPEFDRESGLLRVLHLIEMLQRRGWEVTFGCLRMPTDPERYARVLEQRGVEVHAPLRKLEQIRDVDGFELAIIAFWHVAERFLPELREAAPSTRVVVDSIDLHFVRDARDKLRIQDASGPGQLDTNQAGEMVRELNAYAAADAVLTVSQKEADLINDLIGQDDFALTLPDTEELARSPVPLSKRRGILFLGNFMHAPNLDAASYLCEEIVPRLDPALLSEHEVSIVGTDAGEQVRDLAAGLPHMKIVGWVPSVIPYLNSARVSVVPLRYGAGTKRKIVQALMVGTPTVTTSVGAEGLGVRDRREVLVADDPSEFAAAIERLLQRRLAWRGLARRGRRHILRLHGRAAVEARFDQVLEAVLARRARPAPVKPVAEDGTVDDGIVRKPDYAQLIRRVRDLVQSDVPADAKVLIASRGDDAFLALEGRSGWHFPRDRDGKYAGYYPADTDAAIAHLEEMRTEGATHLVLPRPSFWWLDHYKGLRTHLDLAYREIRSDEHAIIYELAGETPASPASAEPEDEVTPEALRRLQPTPLAAASRYRNGRRDPAGARARHLPGGEGEHGRACRRQLRRQRRFRDRAALDRARRRARRRGARRGDRDGGERADARSTRCSTGCWPRRIWRATTSSSAPTTTSSCRRASPTSSSASRRASASISPSRPGRRTPTSTIRSSSGNAASWRAGPGSSRSARWSASGARSTTSSSRSTRRIRWAGASRTSGLTSSASAASRRGSSTRCRSTTASASRSPTTSGRTRMPTGSGIWPATPISRWRSAFGSSR